VRIKHRPFNEQVLRRLKAKRDARRMLIFRIVWLLALLFMASTSAYFRYQIRHPVSLFRGSVANSAPQQWDISKNEDGIPARLNINGESWYVVRVKNFSDSELAAQQSCQARVIWYLPSDAPSELRNTIVHEIFHAGACLHGGDTWWNSINPNQKTHEGVYHLADFWTGFARANPEFMEWLAK
jgi:hypothetical protein